MRALRTPALGKPIDPPRPSERRRLPEDGLARFLGWFSFALGVPQVAAPGLVTRILGLCDDPLTRAWQRAVGARELAAAAGIFSEPRPTWWLWARVAGDVSDLALLIRGRSNARSPARTMAAIGAVASITGVDLLAARRNAGIDGEETQTFAAAVTVRAAPEDAYRVWHDLANLPRFMAHVDSVQVMNGRSH